MARTKATHNGECQICGAKQAVRDGRLVPHGYAVKWNMFVGVCTGAYHEPFEVSRALIDNAIANADEKAQRLTAKARDLRTNGTTDVVWVHEYQPGNAYARGGYVWTRMTLSATEVPYRDGDGFYLKFSVTDEKGTTKPYDTYGFQRTLGEAVLAVNKNYAFYIEQEAAHWTRYAAWQRTRLQNWQVRPLTLRPVAA